MERFYSDFHWRLMASGLLAAATVGCGSNSPGGENPKGFPTEKPVTDNLPTAENLNYKNWQQFPVGTTIKSIKNSKNAQDWVKETTTRKLIDKTAEKVVIEWQVTVERPNYETKINPPNTTNFFATFKVPHGLTVEQIQAPSLKAKKGGEEEIMVLNQKVKAQIFTWQDGTESGPMEIKAWFADSIPGRLAKQTMKVGQKEFDSLEEVVEITIPGAK